MRAVSNRNAATFAALALTGLSVSAASADVIATFGYTELNGSYNNLDVDGSGNPLYRAAAVNTGSLQTRGDVTRLTGAGGTATFDTGFSSGGTGANYVAAISVIGFGASRPGVGNVTLTDVDGDTLSADVSGTWTPGPGSTGIIYFNGLLSNVVFASNGATGNGTFDGTSGTGFVTADLVASYTGALVQLSTRPGVGFFQGNFSNVSTLVNANIIPAPGSMALVGIAGLVGLRRRR